MGLLLFFGRKIDIIKGTGKTKQKCCSNSVLIPKNDFINSFMHHDAVVVMPFSSDFHIKEKNERCGSRR
jgi:hypothetical protein